MRIPVSAGHVTKSRVKEKVYFVRRGVRYSKNAARTSLGAANVHVFSDGSHFLKKRGRSRLHHKAPST